MPVAVFPSLYESVRLRDVTGPAIRPGGLTLTDRALAYCHFPAGAQLLDVGCGVGATVEYLHNMCGFGTAGVDSSATLIAEGLRRAPDLQLFTACAEALPCESDSQDGLFCECVLSLLESPGMVLQEFRRVLRSGGCLILSDLYNRDAATASDSHGSASRAQIESWLSAAGFRMVVWEDHTRLLRELAARLILANCSLEGLCGNCSTKAQAGYYLLVAYKE